MPFHSLPDGSFSVRAALDLGVTASQLRSSQLARPFWGVRSTQELAGTGLVRAFAHRMPARAFIYGSSAALLHQLPLPARLTRSALPVHVGVPSGTRRPSARDVTAHHVSIAEKDVVLVHDISVTALERTWCDLAAIGLSLGELVAAGDALLWRKHPRSSIGALRAAAGRYNGRRGARVIRTALPLLTDRSDSAPESEIRVAFFLAGLPAPRVNEEIRIGGRLIATPDLSWPEFRVIVEYEGDHHRTDAVQWHRDIERYARLQELGWIVIRATAADYRDPTRLIARVQAALSSGRSAS